jgi:hypothetical protein
MIRSLKSCALPLTQLNVCFSAGEYMDSKHSPRTAAIKSQIMEALSHPEAQEGLYFRNFYHHHEEDERIRVEGEQVEILDALRQLIEEGKVVADDSGKEVIFSLPSSNGHSESL